MDDFAHLSVLLSIVLGLGITNLLMGLARTVHRRDRVKIYWPAVIWALTLLLIHVQTWWTMFGLRQVETWNFIEFFLTLLQPIFLFFLSVLVFPEFERVERFDMRENFFAHSRWFFAIFTALLVNSIARTYAVSGHLQSGVDLVFHAIFFVGAVVGAFLKSDRFHQVAAPAVGLVLFVYIALLSLQLS